jgi:nucleoside-diphosphate-sugar epimerase
MKIVITGCKGMIGSYTFNYAKAQAGVTVFGVDNVGRGNSDDYLSADLTDLGQTIDALDGADAVIHLAAINAQRVFSASKTFITNTAITWNVFEACARLGVPRVVAASSVQVNRTVTMRNPITYAYLPLDEQHPADPQDDYSMGKYVGEVLGDMFSKHYGLTVVSIRPPWVAKPEEVAGLPAGEAKDPHLALYTYIDVRDAARAFFLAATADLPAQSHTVAFISAKDTSVNTPSRDIAKRFFPAAKIKGGLKGNDSLVSIKTAERAFGFVPQYSCRDKHTLDLHAKAE